MPPTAFLAALMLEEDTYLCKGGIIVDHPPSTCASATSVWGSQNIMSMAR
jgi:hypothetical protein